MSTPLVEPPPSPRLPTGLLVASTLCWIWGIMCGFTGLFLLTALKVPGLGTGIVLVFVLLGVVYCVAGYLIRKGRLAGDWMGLIPAGIFSTFTLVALIVTRPISLGTVGGLALNLGIVLSLLLNWRRLRTSRTQVGA